MAFRVHRKDANHNEITFVLDKLGLSVYDLSQVGGGMTDIIVAVNGVNFLFEIKTEKGRLNPAQKAFQEKWQGECGVIRSSYDAVIHLDKYFNSKRFSKRVVLWLERIPEYEFEYRQIQAAKKSVPRKNGRNKSSKKSKGI